MSRCYVVLWIPTVVHTPIPFSSPFHGGERVENISDIPDEEFLIKVKTIERNVDILISKEDDPTQFELFLTLDYVDFSHNGMIKYSFEPKLLGGGEFGFDKDTFPEIVYHIIKSFYHIHEFHEDESDSSLKPYLLWAMMPTLVLCINQPTTKNAISEQRKET